jgi:hypothetical protein
VQPTHGQLRARKEYVTRGLRGGHRLHVHIGICFNILEDRAPDARYKYISQTDGLGDEKAYGRSPSTWASRCLVEAHRQRYRYPRLDAAAHPFVHPSSLNARVPLLACLCSSLTFESRTPTPFSSSLPPRSLPIQTYNIGFRPQSDSHPMFTPRHTRRARVWWCTSRAYTGCGGKNDQGRRGDLSTKTRADSVELECMTSRAKWSELGRGWWHFEFMGM